MGRKSVRVEGMLQVRAGSNTIHNHLVPSGRLLLDFYIPNFDDIAASAISPPAIVELEAFCVSSKSE